MPHVSKPISTTWKTTTVHAYCLWAAFGQADVQLQASTHAERHWTCANSGEAGLIRGAIYLAASRLVRSRPLIVFLKVADGVSRIMATLKST